MRQAQYKTCQFNLKAFGYLSECSSSSSSSCWTLENNHWSTGSTAKLPFDSCNFDEVNNDVIDKSASLIQNGFNVSLWLDCNKFNPDDTNIGDVMFPRILKKLTSELEKDFSEVEDCVR